MAHIFEYSILQATPDRRRGERVNVGIAVLQPGEIDVRFVALAKLRALTGRRWDAHAQEASRQLRALYSPRKSLGQILHDYMLVEDVFVSSEVSIFSIDEAGQYENRVRDILSVLVQRPEPPKAEKTSRINTEIAKVFRRAKILANKQESIETHKIVRDFYVSAEEELKADFALKNGVYHIATTLDLRKPSVNISQAALKALILDKAEKIYGKDTLRFGVYAIDETHGHYRPHLEILRDYASHIFDWSNPNERRAFTHHMYEALRSTDGGWPIQTQ